MKATGIVRRIDDLGRVVIPKEIRRTMRIREGDPSQITLARWQRFSFAMLDLARRSRWLLHQKRLHGRTVWSFNLRKYAKFPKVNIDLLSGVQYNEGKKTA